MMPFVTGKWTFRSSTRRMVSTAAWGNASDMGETGLGVTIRNLDQFRLCDLALVQDRAAARRKGAAGRQAGQIRRLAFDRHQAPAAAAIEARHRSHQAGRIGVLRPGIELARWRY